MSDIAIRTENLGKMFRIGQRTERYKTFRDTVTNVFKRNDNSTPKKTEKETFWALKDVSFEIKRGEVVGVIGRNGAGKSTLLKVLSRITEPTEGSAEIHGRVGSLLEVGTGFHPELTGRENVFLNGAILGMRRAEIEKKFDEIVAFAEVEKFIDTPVKHYSSGMYLRLAFAVAAHLDTEILLVDEVLAVGDAQFQRKCVGKMGEVAGAGRTVVFVSHNLATVVELCTGGILLEGGSIKSYSSAAECVKNYTQTALIETATPRTVGSAQFGFFGLKVNGSTTPTIKICDPLSVTVTLSGAQDDNPLVYLMMEDAAGKTIIHERRELNAMSGTPVVDGIQLRAYVPSLYLAPGFYTVYFKALSTSVAKVSRIVSERLPLVIKGETDALGRALLCPAVKWGKNF